MSASKFTRLQKFGWKLALLYFFSVVFKSFDLSFSHETFAFELRGQLFSLLWVSYGLLVWWIGKSVANIIESHLRVIKLPVRFAILGVVMMVYGVPVVIVFAWLYRMFDVHLFNNAHLWTNIGPFDYALTVGLLLHFFMMITVNGLNYYYRNALQLEVQAERLLKENIQAQYDALRQQIEPHFFFNSLSVLTNLVYKDADLSAQYITQLAKLYRYILERKIENMVPLAAELDFLKSYMFLINIRHQEEIQFGMDLSKATLERSSVPPATLQMLVENAVKHNRFSKHAPLKINLTETMDHIVVTNNLSKREVTASSLGLGLENVKKRYELLGAGNVIVTEDTDRFQVQIPKLFSGKI